METKFGACKYTELIAEEGTIGIEEFDSDLMSSIIAKEKHIQSIGPTKKQENLSLEHVKLPIYIGSTHN